MCGRIRLASRCALHLLNRIEGVAATNFRGTIMMIRKTWGIILRHRVNIQDAWLIIGIMTVAALVAFEFDYRGDLSQDKRIDFEEMLALGALITLGILIFAYRRMSEQEREIARRIAAERHAHELAHTDMLTGLANRRQFEDALKEAVMAPPGLQAAHAVMMLDLNGFKKVNDIHGHSTGDDVLVGVAQRLSLAMREGDMLARLGGDEFAVIAQHLSSAESAIGIANRIIKSLDNPIEIRGVEHRVGAGIGIALIPKDGTDSATILRKADIALYKAKIEKPFAARFFEEDMDRQVRERDTMERELSAAIGTSALRPWYQPIVDLETEAIRSFEALARWAHPSLGDVPPERFIPIAEDCGLINDLSDYLLRCACQDARAWPNNVILSFNLSPVQLRDKTLGLRILKILGETGLAAHRLELELTESAIVRDLEAAKEVLASLRDAGVLIALDDFGTGYSSLYHLRNFKFDKIKIDRSFVEAMNTESESAAIVGALAGLGNGLGLTIIAEGIESRDQQAMLVQQGCLQGQGFLFSKAIPAVDAAALFSVTHSVPQTPLQGLESKSRVETSGK